MIALIDCNNFFASCEQAFNPKLRGKAVVILSSNDGCVIARSKEAKLAGIPMGIPYFKIKDQLRKSGSYVFSSNFRLYRNMSGRVMSILQGICPETEVYSIDEAFCYIESESKSHIEAIAQKIHAKILNSTGLPVSIGVAPTKTLAKIASEYGKRNDLPYFILENDSDRIRYLKEMPVGEVWGVGGQTVLKLREHNIFTAYDFAYAPDVWIRKTTSLSGLHIAHELRGQQYYFLEENAEPTKGILRSQSFGTKTNSLRELEQSITYHILDGGESLREQKSLATLLKVFIETSRHDNGKFYKGSHWVILPEATDNSLTLNHYALKILQKIYRPNFIYKRAGIMFAGLIDKSVSQGNLFEEPDSKRGNLLMKCIDSLNRKFGSNTIYPASLGRQQDSDWKMRQTRLSPCYTNDWKEILTVR